MFDLVQGLWNSVLGKNFFIDARVGLNKILFPTYLNGGNQQSPTDNATGILTGTSPTGPSASAIAIRPTPPASTTSTRRSGGRHEFKFGFDYSHAVSRTEPRASTTSTTIYTSATGRRAQNVTLFATPFYTIDRASTSSRCSRRTATA